MPGTRYQHYTLHLSRLQYTASEALKQTEPEKEIYRKSLIIKYDRRMLRFYPDPRTISLTTVFGIAVIESAEMSKILWIDQRYTLIYLPLIAFYENSFGESAEEKAAG